jgi:hypothetical protein
VTYPPNPPYPPPPPPPSKRSAIRPLLVSILVIGLLFGAVTALTLWSRRDAISRAQIGDCLQASEGADDQSYRIADCADPTAGFTLLATKPVANDCIDVRGVSRTLSDDDQSYCIGEKGVDVTTAINGIKVGECVVFTRDQPSKAACRKGSIPVLLVIKDVDKTANTDALGQLCVEGGAEGVRQTYAWGISAVQSTTLGTWDRLLCLGPATR